MERENYGKKEQKEWIDNIVPDPHPCTAGNKEEEHYRQCFPFHEKEYCLVTLTY